MKDYWEQAEDHGLASQGAWIEISAQFWLEYLIRIFIDNFDLLLNSGLQLLLAKEGNFLAKCILDWFLV